MSFEEFEFYKWWGSDKMPDFDIPKILSLDDIDTKWIEYISSGYNKYRKNLLDWEWFYTDNIYTCSGIVYIWKNWDIWLFHATPFDKSFHKGIGCNVETRLRNKKWMHIVIWNRDDKLTPIFNSLWIEYKSLSQWWMEDKVWWCWWVMIQNGLPVLLRWFDKNKVSTMKNWDKSPNI